MSFSIRSETELNLNVPSQKLTPILSSTGYIAPSALTSTIVINPTGAGLTYILPQASNLISQFHPLVGDIIKFNVHNKGTNIAHILSNPTGGDTSAVIAQIGSATGGSNSTGPSALVRATPVHLSWLAINGTTGAYTIY